MTTPITRRTSAHVLRTVDSERRIVRFVFSDGSVDRMGDTIDPNGWDLSEYKKNPVVLFAHDSNQPPIGRTVNGPWSDGSRLLGDVQFAPPEVYEFADTVFKLVKGGYLNSGSVGFLPMNYTRADDDSRPYGVDYKRQTLLEFSIVPVPANGNALAEARAKGILSRSDLRRLREAEDGTWQGNCGRPLDKECGMKDPAECTIHGFGSVGVGTGEGDDDTKALLAEIRALRRDSIRRIGRYRSADPTPAQLRSEVAEVRALCGVRQLDPRVVAAEAQFRLRTW